MFQCLECKEKFNTEILLYKHIKEHKITQAEYFYKNLPRFDLYDDKPILFKSRDFYLNSDFNSNENLRSWLKSVSQTEVKKYIKEFLLKRKVRKKLIYTPSQVELRSLTIPGIVYLNNLFSGYYDFAESLGFINKYQDFIKWGETLDINKRNKIYIDTREQRLYKFKGVTNKIKKLDYGDYAFSNEDWTGKIFIERKSLTDFIGTLSGGLERFKRELDRAKADDAYLIILVEEKLSNALNYRQIKYFPKQIKIPPEYIFNNVRELIQTYPNIQFLFVDNHKNGRETVEKLFSLGSEVKKYDLQALKDQGIL